MPWSNQGGGGWKSGGSGGGGGGGGGPWGQGPSGGGGGGGGGNNQPPDLEELLKRSHDRFKQVTGGGGISGPVAVLLALAALGAWALSGFYTVRTNEVALNMVFGKFVSRTAEGLNYNWPYPIGTVTKLSVTDVNTLEVPAGSVGTEQRRTSSVSTDSLILTADENIVDIIFSVQWRISPTKPEDFVFNMENPRASIRAMAESAMREVIGKRNLRNVLPSDIPPVQPAAAGGPTPATPAVPAAAAASAQTEILDEVRRVMQDNLNEYGAGVVIDRVIMTRIGPPPEVLASFTDVQAAVQDRDRVQNIAQTHASKVVPEAKGQGEKIKLDAEAYQKRTIAEALGAASKFRQVYDEYRKAPEVTRERMYLETMERVLGGADKIIMEKGSQGVVPYLPLNELNRRPGQPKQ